MRKDIQPERVPITIVTGFLGSGKTTMINFLLEEVGPYERLAIIKNEIGDIAVDSKIIRGKNIIMKELLNGCVCCTLVGDLEDSLKELIEKAKPERIIIEASGAANPAILAVNLDRLDFVKRDMIVTVIDAVNFLGYKDKSVVTELQQKFTDLIVLNKVDLASEEQIDHVLDEIYEIRPGIPVVRTATGRVDPQVLFSLRPGQRSVRVTKASGQHLHGEHLHEDEIQYFSYKGGGRIDRDGLENVLKGLSEEFYRVKGFVLSEAGGAPVLLNYVCGRWELTALSGGATKLPKQTEIVFIGKGIRRYEESVVRKLEALSK